MGGVRLEGKDRTTQPIFRQALAQFNYNADRGIAVAQRVMEIPL